MSAHLGGLAPQGWRPPGLTLPVHVGRLGARSFGNVTLKTFFPLHLFLCRLLLSSGAGA